MTQPATTASARFHAMDGIRASMMLLGIVFHITWFMVPVYFAHPITDVSANWTTTYFFYWVHTFRMQTFFLIAGFFAALLVTKRGVKSFVSNRFMRVCLPFVVSMLTIYPIMAIQLIAGGNQSGRIPNAGEESLLTQLAKDFTTLPIGKIWPVHLWFLETLLLVYAIAVLLWLVFHKLIDRSGAIRSRWQTWFELLMGSKWNAIVLTIPLGALMLWDGSWLGIDTGPLKQKWVGVFTYWFIFAVGWCLYKQPDLLQSIGKGWHWKLAAGTLTSLVLCSVYFSMKSAGKLQWAYPSIWGSEIVDYPKLRRELLAGRSEQDTIRGITWQRLSPAHQNIVESNDSLNSDQLTGLSLEISAKSIGNGDLADTKSAANLSLGQRWQKELKKPAKERDPSILPELNRQIINASFAPAIATRGQFTLGQQAAYFFAYALTTWLLTFGVVGCFNQYMNCPSPRFRYWADSSYWLYLLHMPIQFQIQLWIADLPIAWPVKFSIYLAGSVVVLVPSYHYLVRSTWIGHFLNGRRYPYQPLLSVLWPKQSATPSLEPKPQMTGAAQTLHD